MEKVFQIKSLALRCRPLPLLIIGLALAILASAVLFTSLQVRKKIREQIAGRDGEVLYAVALLAYEAEVQENSFAGPAAQLTVLLKTSQLKGVMGARLFDPAGSFIQAFPPEVVENRLDRDDLQLLKNLRPVSHFTEAALLADLFLEKPNTAPAQTRIPLLEVNVPLHAQSERQLAGVAQFLIEGQSIAREFARLDRHLILQGLGTLFAGGGLLTLAIVLAFRRLHHTNQLLAERTDNLVKANQELALAAKTSALGAVAAHLIHGLKNPLAGLQTFVLNRPSGSSEGEAADWQQAVASTRRMQSMIAEVVTLLREEETGAKYEVTLRELGDSIAARVFQQARDRRVEFIIQLTSEAALPNRVANLVALMLVNLVQNALEATPPGKGVCLSATNTRDRILFEVRDQGSGFSGTSTPFLPCRSNKEGGSGIGLALCKQLANHLGADLQLKSSSPLGCIFSLEVPLLPAKNPVPSAITAT